MGIQAGKTEESNVYPQQMPLESHAVSKLSIWAPLAAELSQEMQILFFVIVRFVNLQDEIMFLVF